MCSCKTALHKQGLSQNMPTANYTGPVLILGPLPGSGQHPGDSKKNRLSNLNLKILFYKDGIGRPKRQATLRWYIVRLKLKWQTKTGTKVTGWDLSDRLKLKWQTKTQVTDWNLDDRLKLTLKWPTKT